MVDPIQGVILGILTLLMAGWTSIWYKLGKLEGQLHQLITHHMEDHHGDRAQRPEEGHPADD